MNVKYSLKSLVRTPVKSVSFVLLTAVLTAFSFLSSYVWFSSAALLQEADEHHTTIVTLDYQEALGSSEGFLSEAMIREVEAIDFVALAAHEQVLDWQPADTTMSAVEGFVSGERDPEFGNLSVFVVTGVREFAANSPLYGKIVEPLYSFRKYEAGRSIFIENSMEYFGDEPDPDAIYVIHALNTRIDSTGLAVEAVPFHSVSAVRAGVDVDAIKPVERYESLEAFEQDQDNVYRQIAAYYSVRGNALAVQGVQNLAERFEFHQGQVEVVAGRDFAREDYEQERPIALISEALATKRELSLGDTIQVRMPDEESASMYTWGDGMSREQELTVVGIVNYHGDYHEHIYVPRVGGEPQPLRYQHRLGQATVRNGGADALVEDWEAELPDAIRLTVYDQGYQSKGDALRIIRNAGAVLTGIAVLTALAGFSFFAYFYTSTHEETVGIMRGFGVKRRGSAVYLLFGAAVILVLGIAAGVVVAARYADGLVSHVYTLVEDIQAVDQRYSDSFRGLVLPYDPVPSMPELLPLIVGAVVLLLSGAVTLSHALQLLRPKQQVSAVVRLPREPKRSSTSLSGPLRHALLSIRRDKSQALLIVVLAGAALYFVGALLGTYDSYGEARESLLAETRLGGYAAKANGEFADRLALDNRQALRLTQLDALEEVSFSYNLHYSYLGRVQDAAGQTYAVESMPAVGDHFELQILQDALKGGPQLVFTDAVEFAPEFYYGTFDASFMEGWDAERFGRRDWEDLPAIVSEPFLEEYGLEMGDTIRVYTQDYFNDMPEDMFLEIDLLVVGSFKRLANQNNIYAPLSQGALAPSESTINDLTFVELSGEPLQPGEYYLNLVFSYAMAGAGMDWTDQEIVDVIADHLPVSSLTFRIGDPSRLTAVKDALQEAGYSGPGVENQLLTQLVIEDADYVETMSVLDQRSRYIEILYPVLMVLVAVIGVVAGYLTVRGRRARIALMRSLGEGKWRIFATLFTEHLLLVGVGSAVAGGVLGVFTRREIWIFAACFLLSLSVAIIVQNRKRAIALLSEID